MVTVVTVCLNAEKNIKKTLQSVLNQRDVEIDYIIKDGKSTDKTNYIIKNEIVKNHNHRITVNHIEEKDEGIYDAMNQAIQYALGEWIIFMNAGDLFFNEFVIRDSISYLENGESAVVYGHTLVELDKRYKFVQIHSSNQLESFFSLGHQSCYVRTEIMKKYMFDSKFRIAGDYDLFLRMFRAKEIFKPMNIIVSLYNREGISAQRTALQYKEVYVVKYGCLKRCKVFYYTGLMIWSIKAVIEKMCPSWEKLRFCVNNMKRIDCNKNV